MPPDDDSPLMPHGGYKNLRSYKVAEAVFDATVVFCKRFYPDEPRMRSQMVQAARSGARNISEGSGAAGTSRKSEMKLTNVALSSLEKELLKDYESFLRQNGLRQWDKDSRWALEMRRRLRVDRIDGLEPVKDGKAQLTGLEGLADFVGRADPEIAANAMLCAVNQATYLIRRQVQAQGRQFMEKGGFTENLYRKRTKRRREQSGESEKSDKSDQSDRSDRYGGGSAGG